MKKTSLKNIRNKALSFIFSISCLASFSQEHTLQITYNRFFNGKRDTSSVKILEISDHITKIYSQGNELYPGAPVISYYTDFKSKKVFQTALLQNGERITVESDFEFEKNWEYTPDTAVILGKVCKKAKIIINSNTIEIYYTEDKNWGTPTPGYGMTKGLVLKTIYNGSRIEMATAIHYPEVKKKLLPDSWGKMMKPAEFQKVINENAVKTVNVFKNQRICFDPSIQETGNIESGKVLRFANGTVVVRMVDLPDSAWKYQIFAELSQYSDGDAYDRTASLFIIPVGEKLSFLDGLTKGIETLPFFTDKSGNKHYGMIATEDYLPPVEMMRFYTSFGTRKYNHYEYGNYNWYDSIVFKQEVSHLAPLLSGKAIIGIFIGNYDKNGHIINLDLKFHPADDRVTLRTIIPLFCTLNIMEMAGQSYPVFWETDTLSVPFELTDTAQNIVLSYLSTGHGGWGGGDEFNKKTNTLMLDDRSTSIIPWRYDCASYRERNPCSGNFYNGLSSSDYSRSGWCPGTITNPVELYYDKLLPGSHSLKVTIPQGEREGESFSAWNVSGILIY